MLVIRKIGIRGQLQELEVDEEEMMKLSGLQDFMAPIEHKIRVESLRREEELEKLRQQRQKQDLRTQDKKINSQSTFKV